MPSNHDLVWIAIVGRRQCDWGRNNISDLPPLKRQKWRSNSENIKCHEYMIPPSVCTPISANHGSIFPFDGGERHVSGISHVGYNKASRHQLHLWCSFTKQMGRWHAYHKCISMKWKIHVWVFLVSVTNPTMNFWAVSKRIIQDLLFKGYPYCRKQACVHVCVYGTEVAVKTTVA